MPAKTKTKNTSISSSFPLLVALTVVLFTVLIWLLSAKSLTDSSLIRGNLDASVNYLGKNCPTNSKTNTTPPCSGPYVNFLVRVFDASTDKVKAVSLTDKQGKVLINLPVGNYYWFGRSQKGELVRSDFVIKADTRTYENLLIDKGIR